MPCSNPYLGMVWHSVRLYVAKSHKIKRSLVYLIIHVILLIAVKEKYRDTMGAWRGQCTSNRIIQQLDRQTNTGKEVSARSKKIDDLVHNPIRKCFTCNINNRFPKTFAIRLAISHRH